MGCYFANERSREGEYMGSYCNRLNFTSIKILTIVLRIAGLFVWIVYSGFNKTVMVDCSK